MQGFADRKAGMRRSDAPTSSLLARNLLCQICASTGMSLESLDVERPAETNDVQSLDLTSGSQMVDGRQMGFTLPGSGVKTFEA